jgi:hypothetical protein
MAPSLCGIGVPETSGFNNRRAARQTVNQDAGDKWKSTASGLEKLSMYPIATLLFRRSTVPAR